MRANRLYGSEGGGADIRSPYPYQGRGHPATVRADDSAAQGTHSRESLA